MGGPYPLLRGGRAPFSLFIEGRVQPLAFGSIGRWNVSPIGQGVMLGTKHSCISSTINRGIQLTLLRYPPPPLSEEIETGEGLQREYSPNELDN
jgi:hypothetical protein